jgi:hypothetical protein
MVLEGKRKILYDLKGGAQACRNTARVLDALGRTQEALQYNQRLHDVMMC